MWHPSSSNLLLFLSQGSELVSPWPEKSPEAGGHKNADYNGQKEARLSLDFLSCGHLEIHADLFKIKASES